MGTKTFILMVFSRRCKTRFGMIGYGIFCKCLAWHGDIPDNKETQRGCAADMHGLTVLVLLLLVQSAAAVPSFMGLGDLPGGTCSRAVVCSFCDCIWEFLK